MSKSISSAYVYYNANSRDAAVGDCVKRALSLAYSMDYDAVSAELNRYKRSFNCDAFNVPKVFTYFLKAHGATMCKVDGIQTLEQFCESHPTGTYVLLTGRHRGGKVSPESSSTVPPSTHMVCVVDGDIYDSWNSSNDIVTQCWVISSSKSENNFGVDDIQSICYNLKDYIASYVNQLNLKDHFGEYSLRSYSIKDDVTLEFKVSFKLLMDKDDPAIAYCDYSVGYRYWHVLTLKLNPVKSDEENIQILQKKAKQKLYDWAYNIRKDITDSIAVGTQEFNSKLSSYSRKDAMKLPEWVRPYVVYVDIGPRTGWNRDIPMSVSFLPIPGDPNSKPVSVYGDNLTEIKNNLNWYKNNNYNRDFSW